jgi:DNA segregation ATPase FtsK/SpoIIIE-like protein
MRHHGPIEQLVTDRLLRPLGAEIRQIGAVDKQKCARHADNQAENTHLPFDAPYDEPMAIVTMDCKCSTGYIQRKLAIGCSKAASLVEQMEDQGVVPAIHVDKREVLVPEI